MPAPHGRGIWGTQSGAICCDVLDAWFEPSPGVREAVGRSLHLIGKSPDVEMRSLKETISSVRGIEIDCLSLGAGSSEIIHRVLPKLAANKKAVVLDPTYSEYRYVLNRAGSKVSTLNLCADHGFNVAICDLVSQPENADLVVIVNPNNPTGKLLLRQELVELRKSMRKDAILWIDEAYIDYCDGVFSMESMVCEFENLFVLKSLSKAYALSGMRAAYLLSSKSSARVLNDESPPWIIGTLSQIASAAALRDESYYKPLWKQTVQMAGELAARLRALELQVIDGSLNAVLVRCPSGSAGAWAQRLAEGGVIVRTTDGMGDVLGGDYIRISVVPPEQLDRVVEVVGGTGLEPVTPSV